MNTRDRFKFVEFAARRPELRAEYQGPETLTFRCPRCRWIMWVQPHEPRKACTGCGAVYGRVGFEALPEAVRAWATRPEVRRFEALEEGCEWWEVEVDVGRARARTRVTTELLCDTAMPVLAILDDEMRRAARNLEEHG